MNKHEWVNGKIIVGLTEKIKLLSENGKQQDVIAKVDTGATKSSIDTGLATKLKLGPIIKSKMIKSAHGNRVRPHSSLNFEVLETPQQAFIRKMRAEV